MRVTGIGHIRHLAHLPFFQDGKNLFLPRMWLGDGHGVALLRNGSLAAPSVLLE
jgi:hypothetical protein